MPRTVNNAETAATTGWVRPAETRAGACRVSSWVVALTVLCDTSRPPSGVGANKWSARAINKCSECSTKHPASGPRSLARHSTPSASASAAVHATVASSLLVSHRLMALATAASPRHRPRCSTARGGIALAETSTRRPAPCVVPSKKADASRRRAAGSASSFVSACFTASKANAVKAAWASPSHARARLTALAASGAGVEASLARASN